MNKNAKKYVYTIITAIIMFAGFFMPRTESLPPYGVQILFIFVGLLFGWSFAGLIIPSLLGLIAMAFTDGFTIKTVWATGFGSELVILITLFCIFAKWLENIGLTDTLVNWFLNRSFFYGKPWTFLTCFFTVIYLLGFFTSNYPAIFLGWACAYKLCDVLGYEKRSSFCGFLVFNIAVIGSMGETAKPWSAWGLTALNSYNLVIPDGIFSYGAFLVWSTIIYFIAIGITLLFGKFVMKIDMDPFIRGNYREAASQYNFDKTQKFACCLLAGMIIALLIPGYLPDCILKSILKELGTIGIVSVVLIIAGTINMPNEKPFFNFKEIATNGGVSWEPIILLTATVPLGNALKSSDAGIMQIITDFVNIYLEGLSPIVFYVAVAVFLGLITQVAHNLVLLTAFTPMFCSVGVSLGMSPEIIILICSIMCSAALGTPAASTRAALLFGNGEYIKLGDAYKLGWFSLFAHLVACCAVGIPLGILKF